MQDVYIDEQDLRHFDKKLELIARIKPKKIRILEILFEDSKALNK
jgi:hypothetical protein